MYSYDRMKTLIRTSKDYDKNIVFKYCQMDFLNIYMRRKEILLIFSVILLNCLQKSTVIGLLLRH